MANENRGNAGRRLPAAVLDDLAKTAPDQKFALIPNGPEVSDGFREVKIRDLAQAVNYASWWIEKTFGRPSKPETLSYMAANDIRYVIFALASNKTGYKVCVVSSQVLIRKMTNLYSPFFPPQETRMKPFCTF